MNLYTQQVAHCDNYETKLFLKLDWLGTEARPHFLCSVETHTHKKPVPACTTLFLLSGPHATECVQIVARLGRALILEAASEGLGAAQKRIKALAEAWNDPDPGKTAWESPGAYTILGQVTGLEFEMMRKYRP